MKLFKRNDPSKPKRVKKAGRIKLFLTAAPSFQAYGTSIVPFPEKEIEKAKKTLVHEDVKIAFEKLEAWNNGLEKPNAQLAMGLQLGLSKNLEPNANA